MMGTSCEFTVFTPTFNRKELLAEVLECLKIQTHRDFEWLIVDDGSSDGTKECVESWIGTTDFPIRYHWKPNGGKQSAMNIGFLEARGTFFLPLDSDDICIPQTLERLRTRWFEIPEEKRKDLYGINCHCRDWETGQLVGEFYSGDGIISDTFEQEFKYGVTGEKWGFLRTDILRRYQFPVDVDRYVPEAWLWYRIDSEYKGYFINEILRVYRQDARVRVSNMLGKYAHGMFFFYSDVINQFIGRIPWTRLEFWKQFVLWNVYRQRAKLSLFRETTKVHGTWKKFLVLFSSPVATLLRLSGFR
ncbi:MAG: glycosyltransferase family 2 protein [Bdellovibrionota bacterium]